MATATQRSKKDIEETGPKSVEELVSIGGVADIPADRPESVELANAINTARSLLEQKKDVLAKLQEAREYSTMSVNMGNGSPEQVAWVRFYLPRKKRSTGSDNGADEEE